MLLIFSEIELNIAKLFFDHLKFVDEDLFLGVEFVDAVLQLLYEFVPLLCVQSLNLNLSF